MQPYSVQNNGSNSKGSSLFSRFAGGSASKNSSSTRPSTSNGTSNHTPQLYNQDSLSSQGSSEFESLSKGTSSTHSSHRPKTPSTTRPSIIQPGIFSPPKPEGKRIRPGPPVSLRSQEGEQSHRKSLTLTRSESNSNAHEHLQQGASSADTSQNSPYKENVRDSFTSTSAYSNMLSNFGSGFPTTYRQSIGPTMSSQVVFGGMTTPLSPTIETITYQHIQEMSSKRISTLDYLRKAHEGRVYWFNTLLFTKADLSKIPYFEHRKLARRATNYLLLGLSLPTVLDLNSSNALEFLRTLNALLSEFESFQQIHPPDGSASSMSRARIPQMFKRATGVTASKARRTSSAADIGLPFGSEGTYESSGAGNHPVSSFPSSENDLLPGEEYTHLLTPSLPFDPDFYETFATLCDVLIDCYQKLMQLVPTPKDCGPAIAEAFTHADKKVRKIIVNGVVKEFEDASRAGVRAEVAGVGKVVLGGLM